jgi:O-antigen/teichoic acid export membrane protein
MRATALGFTLSILCASGWIAACVIAANGVFVRLWVGPEQFGGVALTVLLSLAFVMNQLGGALVQLTFYLGNVRVGSIAGITSSLSFLGLAYVFLPRWGMIGAPLALSISLAATALPSLLFSIWTVTKSFGGQGGLLLGWFVRFAFLIGGSAAIGVHLSMSSIGAFLLGVFLASALTAALFGGYLYREPLRSIVRDRIVAHPRAKLVVPVLNALERPAMMSHRPFGRS